MIILIGFSKCGTTSFDYFFKSLGLKTIQSHTQRHEEVAGQLIYKAKEENKPLLTYLQHYDVITDLTYSIYDVKTKTQIYYYPQIYLIEEIYNQNKDAIYILNNRNVKDHFKSFIIYDIFLNDNKEYFDKYYPNYNDEDKFCKFLEDYYIKMRILFKDAKFIDYNIDTDTIDKLSKYIDIKDNKELPYLNKTLKFNTESTF